MRRRTAIGVAQGDAQVARFWKGLGQPAKRGADEGASSKSSSKAGALTPFPKDYAQMVTQCQKALQAGLDDGLGLMEIQFPPGGLETAPGDVEGNMESNLTVQHLRGICAQFERNKTAKTTRVFFPDPIEAKLARTGTNRRQTASALPQTPRRARGSRRTTGRARWTFSSPRRSCPCPAWTRC